MPPRVSDYERILQRALQSARGWPLDADPARPRADRDRHHGSHLRGRFDSRSLRHHTGPVYCLYFKRLRDHRFAIALLFACAFDRPFHLPADGTRIHPRLCGDQNDHRGLLPDFQLDLAGFHCTRLGCDDHNFDDRDRAPCRGRQSKIVLPSLLKIHLTIGKTMKNLFIIALVLGFAGNSFGDIQDPPANDYGPTRKLGRGFSNFFLAPTEIPVTIAKINEDEGNSAAAGYGVWRGLGRSATRHVAGLLEILTWPFPAWL